LRDFAIVAITPPSDIVLDVARAADPERYRAAVERLTNLRASAAAVASRPPAAPERRAAPATAVANDGGFQPGAPVRNRRRLDAYGQFEAFVLQSFVQSMLPKNATNVYGRGTAGEVWRSMLAEKIGEELARSGQVGIAQRLAASGGRQPPPVADPAATAELPASPAGANVLAGTASILPVGAPPVTAPRTERSS
jgi:hypothetical protein